MHDYISQIKGRSQRLMKPAQFSRNSGTRQSTRIPRRFVFLTLAALGLGFVLLSTLRPDGSRSLAAENTTTSHVPAAPLMLEVWPEIREEYLALHETRDFGDWLKNYSNIQKLPDPTLGRLARAESNLRDYLEAGNAGVPGLSFGMNYRGVPVFRYQRNLGTDTARPLASVSKTITSVAVLQLVQAGKIGLDDSIALYFPDVPHARKPVDGKPITIRDLLRHSSGISYAPSGGITMKSPHRNMYYTFPKQYRAAGTAFNYSNYNYNILALLIERVSGQSLEHYLKQNIFDPMQMNHTRLSPIVSGAAGVYSTVPDLSRFMSALMGDDPMGRRLLDQELVEAMLERPPYIPAHPEIMYYGLGVRVQHRNGRPEEIYHTGLWKRVFADIRYYVNDRTTLVHLGDPPHFRSASLNSYRYKSIAIAARYARKLHNVFPDPVFTTNQPSIAGRDTRSGKLHQN